MTLFNQYSGTDRQWTQMSGVQVHHAHTLTHLFSNTARCCHLPTGREVLSHLPLPLDGRGVVRDAGQGQPTVPDGQGGHLSQGLTAAG